MQIMRMFGTGKYKGSRNYLNSQKKYEILRTVIYFGISISLFLAGWIMMKDRANVLTIVAVLGCLPASRSAVAMILFLRYHSCSESAAGEIVAHQKELSGLYDMVFTSYNKNFVVSHITVKGNTVCGYTEDDKFAEQEFYKHIDGILKAGGFSEVSIKIFTDLKKYCNRLDQLQNLENSDTETEGILATLKSVTL